MTYASVFKPQLFNDQVAIVTGGGSGIGRCIAHELSALGATVVLASRTKEKLERVAQEIVDDGGKADAIACNIRKEAEVKALVQQTIERHGRLDHLVNNGGGQFLSPAESISEKGFRAVVETNLTGTFLMCREAYSQYFEAHGGAIVNIVADMFRGMPMMSHSGAARAGVVNLTKSLSLEWAASRVRVNAIAPGLILSSGFESYPPPVQETLRTLPQQLPQRRFGTESEISGPVVFLLSPAAAYISGATLRVDGASSLYRHTFQLPPGKPSEPFDGFHRSSQYGFDEVP